MKAMHSIQSVMSGASRLDLESSKQKMHIQSVKSMQWTEPMILFNWKINVDQFCILNLIHIDQDTN